MARPVERSQEPWDLPLEGVIYLRCGTDLVRLNVTLTDYMPIDEMTAEGIIYLTGPSKLVRTAKTDTKPPKGK